MKRAMQGLMMASILMVGAIGIASAALPEPQDPQVVANMSFEQRLQMSKDLREQFKGPLQKSAVHIAKNFMPNLRRSALKSARHCATKCTLSGRH